VVDERGQLLDEDAGFTLVETMVAIVLVTIAMFALMAELTAYVHHQANERRRTTAVRYLTTTLEKARGLTASDLALVPTGSISVPAITDGGVTYSGTEVVARCLVSDPVGSCTPTSANDAHLDTRLRVTITWPDGTATRSVSSYTSLADTANTTYSPTGSGTISTLVGGTGQAASGVSVSAFTATPSTSTVTSAGVPTSPITLNLTTVGLNSSTGSIPVTWTDDGGSHQTTLTGGPNSWSVTIPAASISKVVASGTSTLTFAATVPGTSTISTVVTTLRPGVSITSCSVSPNPLVLTLITRKTTLAETLSCTVFGLASSDSVTVAFTSGSSTTTRTLTSSDGASWSVVLPSATSMASSGLSETFTFTATRASDGLTATNVVTGVLA
jgi:prepilin-type N-terminal cleavage/methylation domain-containing protein